MVRNLGRPADALPLIERALAIDEATYGPDNPSVASDLNYLADVLDILGRSGDALPLAERALTIDEAAYGPDHPHVANDLIFLADVLRDLGRDADAERAQAMADPLGN